MDAKMPGEAQGVEELANRLAVWPMFILNGAHWMRTSLQEPLMVDAANMLRQQAERIAALEADVAKVIRARNQWEDACQSAGKDMERAIVRIAALEAASAAWQSLASDYWAAYPFGRLGERYRALLGDSK